MSEALLELNNVSWFDGAKAIVEHVSFTIKPSEIVTLIGPNGAGKSTVVNLATGLLTPSTGSVIQQPELRIGYMPQHLRFDETLPITVERFLKLASTNKALLKRFSDKLGITKLNNTQLRALSGGEMQRVLLARACLRQPHLLVLDEPTQGVDVGGQGELYKIISDLRDELKCGVLMVSHDLHLVMAKTDTVICINRHVCCHGEPESVEKHPEYLALFGKQSAQTLAVYTHNHDHEHDLHGDVVEAEHHEHKGCKH